MCGVESPDKSKNIMLINTCLVFLCFNLVLAHQEDNYTEVFIKTGRIRGHLQLVKAEDSDRFSLVSYFLGIPYAKPPVGELRFKQTELPEPWEGTLKVDKMPPACPQHSKYPYPWVDTDPGQSEDCLYLNVWAPMDAVTGDFKRPVKFYIHGDDWLTSGSNRMGYYNGHGDAFDSDEKAKDGSVVVTVNYRLGALGFLSSGTEDAPGNVGLYDIVTALEWTRDNIASFGGDPEHVALVGQGGGAIASSLLLQAPRTANLFSTLILDGSTLYTLKTLRRYNNEGDGYGINIKLAGELAHAVGCKSSTIENPADTVQCLRDVDASQLVRVLSSFSKNQPLGVFLPQFGRDDLVPSDPFRADWHSIGQFVLLGFNSDEGSHLLTTRNPNIFGVFGEKDVGISAKRAKRTLKKFLSKFGKSVVEELLGDLDEEPTIQNRKKVIKAMGDAHVVCPTLYLAEKYMKKENEVYILEKKVYPLYNPWADWMGSVHFNNVLTDYVHLLNETIVVNGKSYTITKEESEMSIKFKENILKKRWTKFTNEDRLYNIFNQNIEGFDGGTKSNPGGRNCEILRPYFVE